MYKVLICTQYIYTLLRVMMQMQLCMCTCVKYRLYHEYNFKYEFMNRNMMYGYRF